jgi:hypothetical protein
MTLIPKIKSDVQFNGEIKVDKTWKNLNINEVEKEFRNRFDNILEELKKLEDDYNWNKIIYESKFNFKPIIGKDYHLYKEYNKYLLSLIGPNEWNKNYIGTFKMNYNMKWIKIKE